jgi:hypothetical protein
VHGKDGDLQISIEHDVVDQVIDRARIGLIPRRLSEPVEVVCKAESGLAIQGIDLIAIDGTLKLLRVVDAYVPRGLPPARRSISTRWFRYNSKSVPLNQLHWFAS